MKTLWTILGVAGLFAILDGTIRIIMMWSLGVLYVESDPNSWTAYTNLAIGVVLTIVAVKKTKQLQKRESNES
jgi:hypothetical protein